MNWEDWKRSWPNARMSRFVTAPPFHRWHVQEAGQGPVILFIHGTGASTHSWRDILPPVSGQARVFAIDLPGQGFTKVANLSRSGLPEMSADIATLLAQEEVAPAMIVGHSAGAAIALRLALDLPQPPRRVVTFNAALGKFEGSAGHVFPALANFLARNPLVPLTFSWLGTSRHVVRQVIEATGSTLDDRGIDLYRALLSDRAHDAATLAMMSQWDLTRLNADLPRWKGPTTLVVGENDLAVSPQVSETAAARLPAAKLEVHIGLGHLLHEERPDVATAAVLAST